MFLKFDVIFYGRFFLIFMLSDDLIEIQEVTLLNKSQEWTDDVYSLSGGVMDGVSADAAFLCIKQVVKINVVQGFL